MTQPGMFHEVAAQAAPATRIRKGFEQGRSLPGRRRVLTAGTARQYKDVKIGSGPPDRFLFSQRSSSGRADRRRRGRVRPHRRRSVRMIDVDYEVLPAVPTT